MNTTDFRPIDKVVGFIIGFYALCGVSCGAIVAGGGTLLGMILASQSTPKQPDSAVAGAVVGGAAVVIGGFIIACYILNAFGAVGIIQGKRWGFILSAALLAITFLGGLSGATGGLNLLPDLALCLYLVLRLTGHAGSPVK